jgi:phosphoribosylformylglycinamidine synthase
VPQVHVATAKATFLAIHDAIKANLVQACHDLSEGGLAVASAEMAFAGSLGATLHLARVPHDDLVSHPVSLLFSESNSRFLCEVAPDRAADFEALFETIAENGPLLANIGEVTATNRLQILTSENNPLIDVETERLKAAWQKPLAW